jgi:hypothetical protein
MTPAEFSSLFDEAHAITCKAVGQVPEALRDFRPTREMMLVGNSNTISGSHLR